MQSFLGELVLGDAAAGSRIAFVPFALILSACVLFVGRCVPETRGRSVRQVRQAIAAGLVRR